MVAGSSTGTWWARQKSSTLCPSTSFGPVQPFGERSTIIGQRGRAVSPVERACCLMRTNLEDALLQRRGHFLMHRRRVVAFNEVGFLAISGKQRLQFVMGNARKDCGIGDLVAIEVKDRQDGSIANRIQELVGMPRGGKRAGLGFAVPDHDGDDEIGIVKSRAVGVRDGIAKFAAFVNRTWRLRGAVTSRSLREMKIAGKT